MSVSNRAKIFSPFAALRGYEDTEHPAIPPLGTYETVNGKVEMIDGVFRQITISDGSTKVTVPFNDLEEVSGEGIVNIDEFLGISDSDDPD